MTTIIIQEQLIGGILDIFVMIVPRGTLIMMYICISFQKALKFQKEEMESIENRVIILSTLPLILAPNIMIPQIPIMKPMSITAIKCMLQPLLTKKEQLFIGQSKMMLLIG